MSNERETTERLLDALTSAVRGAARADADDYWGGDTRTRLLAHFDQVMAERDKLHEDIRSMVEKAAIGSLAGYRELGATCASLSAERDAIRGQYEAALILNRTLVDELKALRASNARMLKTSDRISELAHEGLTDDGTVLDEIAEIVDEALDATESQDTQRTRAQDK